MMQNNTDHSILLDDFVEGTLSRTGITDLLHALESDPNLIKTLGNNLLADYLLKEKNRTLEEHRQKGNSKELAVPSLSYEDEMDHLIKELLEWERNAIPLSRPFLEPPISRGQILKKIGIRSFQVLSLMIIVVFCFWISLDAVKKEYFDQKDIPPNHHAIVAELIDVQWADPSKSYKRGEYILNDRLHFLAGTVQLKFKNGAELILEGPVDLSLKDQNGAFCSQGKISAHIPSNALGFEIITPSFSLIDRGTDFVVDIDPENTQVAVIKGLVDLVSANKLHKISMKAGSAIKTIAERFEKIDFFPDLYISPDHFYGILRQFSIRELKKNKEIQELLIKDPSLLARFDFNSLSGNTVPNLSLRGTTMIPRAHLYGTENTEGSLPQTNAILFRKKNAEVLIDLPGEYRNLTLICKTRLDLLRSGSVVLASKDARQTQGALIWQQHLDGRFQIEITEKNKTFGTGFNSEKIVSPKDLNTWIVLAVVLDADRKIIRFYKDGNLISQKIWPDPISIHPGNIALGNLSDPKSRSHRELSGAIESFSIYDQALNEKEIQNIQ